MWDFSLQEYLVLRLRVRGMCCFVRDKTICLNFIVQEHIGHNMPKNLPFLDLLFKMFFSKLKQAWFSGGWAVGNTRSSLVTGELVQI